MPPAGVPPLPPAPAGAQGSRQEAEQRELLEILLDVAGKEGLQRGAVLRAVHVGSRMLLAGLRQGVPLHVEAAAAVGAEEAWEHLAEASVGRRSPVCACSSAPLAGLPCMPCIRAPSRPAPAACAPLQARRRVCGLIGGGLRRLQEGRRLRVDLLDALSEFTARSLGLERDRWARRAAACAAQLVRVCWRAGAAPRKTCSF